MQIASYFASLGFKVDRNSVRNVDRTLDNIEKRLRKFGSKNNGLKLNLTGFTVDQAKLNLALGNALDLASSRTTFEITRFVINEAALLAAIIRAMRGLPPLPPGPHPPPVPPGPRPPGSRSPVVNGGFTGAAARVYGPALALGFGGYGLAQLNQRNQQVVSAQLQTQAVVQQAGGSAAQGSESFQYLRREANRIGFNYLDASQDYNKLISGLTGSGISVKDSQKVFSGFAELARVNKLDKTTQNRLFRALSQVAGKGKLQSEELTGQIAEALPGGTALFAQAYQKQIGGNKTGSEAIQQLLADMKKGKVTSDILTYAGAAASQRAQSGLIPASQASQAEQQRYQNSVSDLAVVASNSGVEEGFARIFRTLSTGLSESNGLVRGLAEGFNEATKVAEKLLLFPQSFTRALEGRDSLIADWLGEGQTKELREDWSEIRASLQEIFGMKSPEWINPLREIAQQLKDLIAAAGGISAKYRETKVVAQQIQQDAIDEYGGTVGGVIGLAKANYFTFSSALGLGGQGVGYGLNKVKDTLPFGNYTPVSGLVGDFANYLSTPTDSVAEYYVNRDRKAGLDVESMYGPNGEGFRDFNKERNRSLAVDVFGNNGYSFNGDPLYSQKSSADTYKQGETQQTSTTTTNLFKAEFTVTGDRGDIESWVKNSLSQEIEKVMVNLPEK